MFHFILYNSPAEGKIAVDSGMNEYIAENWVSLGMRQYPEYVEFTWSDDSGAVTMDVLEVTVDMTAFCAPMVMVSPTLNVERNVVAVPVTTVPPAALVTLPGPVG